MTTREHLVRALWTVFEPVHAVSYFSTQAREAFAEVGLTRYWDGYFAGRAAPLGAVAGPPVTAIFSGFAPALVERALPAAWSIASVDRVLVARSLGAATTLRELVPDEGLIARASAALSPIAQAADCIGRPLAAANQALPAEDDPYRQLWQSAATLREHRGDGHVIALVTEDIAGLTTLVLRSGVDLEAATMRKARGWSEEEWSGEVSRQVARGLLDSDRAITAAGIEALARAEHVTNRLAVGPWSRLTDDEILEVAGLLAPIARAVGELFPYPNPIGMPRPWDPERDPDARLIPIAPAA